MAGTVPPDDATPFSRPGEQLPSATPPDVGVPTPLTGEKQAEYIVAELTDTPQDFQAGGPRTLTEQDLQSPHKRRVGLPVMLFLATCLTTFWVGATRWEPTVYLFNYTAMDRRITVVRHWDDGLIYMACVLAILLAHEMGHFITTLRYRIPASMPYFIPLPITPIGTMGAVIGMDGLKANRKELFDIGLAGPVAGLIIAFPILCVGISHLDLNQSPLGSEIALDMPLLVNVLMSWFQPEGYTPGEHIWSGHSVATSQLNPYFMAGWVGLLITGLNMLPISQLDGGHVIYTLFGKYAHWIARVFLFVAILFIVFFEAQIWFLMVLIVILIGTDHPPTSDDSVRLGPIRTIIGYASLLIPILCFPPYGIRPPVGM